MLAGPTAAGKTEITERIRRIEKMGKKVTTIEVDNFALDRDLREDKVMGKGTTHFEIFIRSLEQILQGKKIVIPDMTSSTPPPATIRTAACAPVVSHWK